MENKCVHGTVNEATGLCSSCDDKWVLGSENRCDKEWSCVNGTVDEESGHCSSCNGHWDGEDCNICQKGWVLGAEQNCNAEVMCVNGTPNSITGACDECHSGWIDVDTSCTKCQEVSTPSSFSNCIFEEGHNSSAECQFTVCGETYRVAYMTDDKLWIVDNLRHVVSPQSTICKEDKGYCYYNFAAAQNVCPPGWKLPENQDYINLISKYHGQNDCKKSGSGDSSNEACITVLKNAGFDFPVSAYYTSNSDPAWGVENGYLWTSTTNTTNNNEGFFLKRSNVNGAEVLAPSQKHSKTYYLPVRCVKKN